MMEFKFDLQMFASTSITPYDGSGKAYFVADDGWHALETTTSGVTAVVYYENGTYYANVATTNFLSTTFTGTVVAVSALDNTTAGSIKPTLASQLIGLGATSKGVTATTPGGKITFKNGAVTGMSGTGTVTVTGTVSFENASGTVKGVSANGSYALTSFYGEVNAGVISDFTKGTVKSSSTNTAADVIRGATFTGAVTVSTTDGNTYSATLNGSAQTVSLANAAKAFNVTGSAGADEFTTHATNGDTISAGAGADKVTITAGAAVVSIDGGAGNDKVELSATGNIGNNSTILGGDGKDTVDVSNATGRELWIDGGTGDDSLNAGANVTDSAIQGGAGKDTLISKKKSNILTGGADADAFDISDAAYEANISDYKFGEDVLLVKNNTVIDTAISWAEDATGDTLKSDGTSGFITDGATDGKATITSSTGYFAVTLQDADKNKVALGWVGENATNINASSLTTPVVLTGKTNTEADLLIGGAKADTIYAGTGDSIYGGAGKDSLNMTDGTYGVYVGIATESGADTVTGFTTGFDIDSADAVYMVNGTSADFGASADGTNLILKDGGASMTLAGGNGVTAGASGAYELLVSGKKVAVATNKGEIKTDDLTYADYWFGTYNKDDKTGSAANLSGVTDAVNVNLGDTEHIRYIYTVTGGSGNTTLMGGNNAERLVAASGSNTSLYGGAGKDTLVSSGDSKTEFFFMNGAGNDEITDFTTGTDTDASDVLNFYGSALGSISRTADNVVKIKTSDGSTLSVNQKTNSADEKLQWVSGEAKGVAKVATSSGSSLSYETDVTNYFGSSKKDTIAVGAGDGTDVNIWLDGSQGVSYSDIDVVDASGRAANTTIAGSAIAETITGGSGNASVWGGAGQVADVLRSTSGSTTTFFYGLGNGSDNISGSANDTVNLFDIKLSDIASANIQNSQVIFTTSSKDTVTVSGAQTFQLADGSRWTANYSNNQWESAQ